MTRICVFGAGAIGGHLAVKLAVGGADVSVVVRTPAHAAAINQHGLTLETTEGERLAARPFATGNPEDLPRQDIVLVTAKAHGLPAAAPGLAVLARQGVPMVYFTNGIPWWYDFGSRNGGREGGPFERLDPGGHLWNAVGPQSALGGIAYSANARMDPLTIRSESSRNLFVLGEPAGGGSDRLDFVVATARSLGLDFTATVDVRLEIWRKLLGNLANSPVACLTGLPGYLLAADPDLRRLYEMLFLEGHAVAAALGHVIADTAAERLDKLASIHHRTSMLQDLDAGRPIEIDAQLFAVQDLARRVSVPTPVLDTLLPLLAARARAVRAG